MKDLKISIVIPFYNDPFIGECLNTLMNQEYPMDKYEIIVVDNLSDSKYRTNVKAYQSNITLVNQPIKGSYYCRNVGISLCNFDVIAFTDSDCAVDSQWLRAINTTFQQSDNMVAALQGNSGVIKDNEVSQAIYEKYSQTFHDYVISKEDGRYCNRIDTRNCAIKSSVIHEIGLFNEKMQIWGDAEMGQRIIQANYKIQYADDMKVSHKNINNIDTLVKKRIKEGINITKILRKFGAKYTRKFFPEMLFVFVDFIDFETGIREKKEEINHLMNKYRSQQMGGDQDGDQKRINQLICDLSNTAFILGTIEERLSLKESNRVYQTK